MKLLQDTFSILINKAKKIIEMTMDMEEEIKSPLPLNYHKNLAKLFEKGIKINRYVYGAKKFTSIIKNLHPEISTIYVSNLENYLRILIIDKKEGIFKLKNVKNVLNIMSLINFHVLVLKLYVKK